MINNLTLPQILEALKQISQINVTIDISTIALYASIFLGIVIVIGFADSTVQGKVRHERATPQPPRWS